MRKRDESIFSDEKENYFFFQRHNREKLSKDSEELIDNEKSDDSVDEN